MKHFKWNYARKSWLDVKRTVLIDFGEESLLLVKEGMATSRGRGILVTKEAFIKKYGGNYEYYFQLNRELTLKK